MSRGSTLIIPAITILCVAGLLILGSMSDHLTIANNDFERLELQLNEFTTSAQSHVALDMDEAGDVVAVWDSRRQDSGYYGVFARWIDAAGNVAGPEEQVNVEKLSMQMDPAVSMNEQGRALFSWQSFNQDGQLGAIVCRSDGDERIANETTAGDQTQASSDYLGDGRYVAVWTTTSKDDPINSRIAVRILTPEGLPVSDEVTLTAPDGCRDNLPTVAAVPDGGFVMAWARVDSRGDAGGIYACRFDQFAEPISSPFRVSETCAPAIEPTIASDAEGRVVVGWLKLDHETDYDVVIRRFDSDGLPLGPETVASLNRTGIQNGAAVSMSPDGRLLVAWNDESDDGLKTDITARLFDSKGKPICADFRVNRHTGGIQSIPAASGTRRIALGNDGRMVFAWHGDSGNGDKTAANITMLIPATPGLSGYLAAGLRRGRAIFASLLPHDKPRFDATAMPHVPPAFDETESGLLLDPHNMVFGERGFGFTAFPSTGWNPPDPHMAAGHDHLMATVNGGLAAFEKDGTLIWQEDISGSAGFWGELGADYLVFDPEVIYDPYENRFIAMANERSDNNRSMMLLGISSTSNPADPWYKYRFDVTTLADRDIDSPNISVDTRAIYITADFFSPERYLVFIIEKGSVLDGGTAATTSVLRTGSQSFGLPVMYTSDAPTMYMIEHFEDDPSYEVRLWAIEDPLGTPSLTSYLLDVPAYYRPANLRSQGTTARPWTFDSRFWSCMYTNGSLWACHHMSLSNSPRITVSRWYEIEMNGWPESKSLPTLRQSGTVDPEGQVYCSFNSIVADANGTAVMCFARSSTQEYFSISRVYRLASDPLGYMREPEYVKQSDVAYTRERWGDYSAIVRDPALPFQFWMHHEYAIAATTWHTWIGGEQIPDPNSSVEQSDLETGTGLTLFPNPTMGPATLAFDLPGALPATASIFDIAGRLVRTIDLGELSVGAHQVEWDGRDSNGLQAPNGIYMVRLESAGQSLANARLTISR